MRQNLAGRGQATPLRLAASCRLACEEEVSTEFVLALQCTNGGEQAGARPDEDNLHTLLLAWAPEAADGLVQGGVGEPEAWEDNGTGLCERHAEATGLLGEKKELRTPRCEVSQGRVPSLEAH